MRNLGNKFSIIHYQELEGRQKTYRFNCDNPTGRKFLENQDLVFL